MSATTSTMQHSLFDDLQALVTGVLFVALGLALFQAGWADDRRMGLSFTLKTLAAVSLLVGAGFIILFRHKASLGGLNMLVMLWCQERFGWRAGVVQMLIDSSILLASWPWLDASRLALSILADGEPQAGAVCGVLRPALRVTTLCSVYPGSCG